MESSSGISLARAEAFLRLFAILVLVLTACLLGFDTQTKLLFSTIKKTATFRDLGALQVVVYVDSVAAGYNLLQLGRGFISAKLKGKLINVSYVTLPWVCFLLDQAAVYTVFSANTAALQASIIAVTGESSLQWMKDWLVALMEEKPARSMKRPLSEDDVLNKPPMQKRVKFPKGKKVKPGDEVLNAGKDEDVPSELKDPRLAAKERAKHRTQITAELFSEESRGIFHDISAAEMNYEAILGLRINLDKSELIPVGCVENVEALAAELGCKVGSLPSSYLGLPLGAPFKSFAAWDGVEERFRKRLTMWKRQYISKGGRLTLIWSTLASLLIYFMFVLTLPRTVRLSIFTVSITAGFISYWVQGKAMTGDLFWQGDENFDDDGIQIEPFNLNQEREEGYFDSEGNFVEYVNEKEIKDAWLDSVDLEPKFDKRNSMVTKVEDDTQDLTTAAIGKIKRRIADLLEPGETILEKYSGQDQGNDPPVLLI
uniref:CASP-like protein n=1 Tax=Vitis vinifera TaxID=29760 RepID=A5C3N9_VITVI|nr:hypothetical protein VITISV_022648 [Vitis vinifera]